MRNQAVVADGQKRSHNLAKDFPLCCETRFKETVLHDGVEDLVGLA